MSAPTKPVRLEARDDLTSRPGLCPAPVPDAGPFEPLPRASTSRRVPLGILAGAEWIRLMDGPRPPTGGS